MAYRFVVNPLTNSSTLLSVNFGKETIYWITPDFIVFFFSMNSTLQHGGVPYYLKLLFFSLLFELIYYVILLFHFTENAQVINVEGKSSEMTNSYTAVGATAAVLALLAFIVVGAILWRRLIRRPGK